MGECPLPRWCAPNAASPLAASCHTTDVVGFGIHCCLRSHPMCTCIAQGSWTSPLACEHSTPKERQKLKNLMWSPDWSRPVCWRRDTYLAFSACMIELSVSERSVLGWQARLWRVRWDSMGWWRAACRCSAGGAAVGGCRGPPRPPRPCRRCPHLTRRHGSFPK